jgi:hypothetical protein
MAPARKARTATFRRGDALVRAEASTRLEGGRLSDAQRALITLYRDGQVSGSSVMKAARENGREA